MEGVNIPMPVGKAAPMHLCSLLFHYILPHPEDVKIKQRTRELTTNCVGTAFAHSMIKMAAHV